MSIYLICIYLSIGALFAATIVLVQRRNNHERKVIQNLKQKNSTLYIKYDLETKEIVINNEFNYMNLDVSKLVASACKDDVFNESIREMIKNNSIYNCQKEYGDKIYSFSFTHKEKVDNYSILRCDYNVEKTIEPVVLKNMDDLKKIHDETYNKGAALYYLNIKEFNVVNQRYGQKCGDYVLEVLKTRFAKLEKNKAVSTCYLGADQFAIYYDKNNLTNKKAMHFIKETTKKLTKTIDVGYLTLDLLFGVGVCVGDFETLDEFIKRAYVASDYAKKRKKYNIVMYNESMKKEDDLMDMCERELETILEHKDVSFTYNPVFYHAKSKFIGYIGSPAFSNHYIKIDALRRIARQKGCDEQLVGHLIESQLISYLKKRPKKSSKLFINLNLGDLPIFLEKYLSNSAYSDCKVVICLNVKKGYEMLNKFSNISATISKIIEEGIEFSVEINYANMYNYDYILKNARYLVLDETMLGVANTAHAKNKFLNIIELAKTYDLDLFATDVKEYMEYENLLKYDINYFSGSYFGKGNKKPNEIELSKTKIFAKFIKDSKKGKKGK